MITPNYPILAHLLLILQLTVLAVSALQQQALCGLFSDPVCWWQQLQEQGAILKDPVSHHVTARSEPRRIAVIGAGPAGASFAYFASRSFPSAYIDVFESGNRTGGRCKSERLIISERLNISILVETGASIFVEENKNLVHAARTFQLTVDNQDDRKTRAAGRSSAQLNNVIVWNGTHTLFEMDINGGWRSKLKGFLRYKFGASTTGRLANDAAAKLSAVYDEQHPGYNEWPDMIDKLGLHHEVNVSAAEYAVANGINGMFVDEVFETVSRVNYGRNLDEIHSLAALVGFVKGPTYSILEGNQRIFEEYLVRSKAQVHYNAEATAIIEADQKSLLVPKPGYQLTTTGLSNNTVYDLVVVAVPPPAMQSIKVPASARVVQPVPYHHIHVTFVLGKLNRTTFPSRPAQVLLTRSVPNIQSIALVWDYGYELLDYGLGLYKVFSTVPLTNFAVPHLFQQVRQTWPRQWLSYPIMQPEANITEFYPPLKLHQQAGAGGIYYLNGLERFISTMETATVASRNLVRVLQCQYNPTGCT